MAAFRSDRTDGGRENAAATERTNGPGENKTADTEAGGEQRYSIIEDFEDENGNHYDNAVLLDTNVFDSISPRDWSKALQKHIENRVQNSTFIMPVEDENGDWQDLEFARLSDTIRTKSGNRRSVLSELYQTSDNISKLSAVHIDEIVTVSEESVPYHTVQDTLHNHGWLDKNGFLHRNAYVINAKNGNIYQVALDIAKTDDGRTIAFALNGKTRKIGRVNVGSIASMQKALIPHTDLSGNNNTTDANNSQEENAANSAYLSLAEKYRNGTASEEETAELQRAAEQAANKILQRGCLDNEE